jgi:hypothetical protein
MKITRETLTSFLSGVFRRGERSGPAIKISWRAQYISRLENELHEAKEERDFWRESFLKALEPPEIPVTPTTEELEDMTPTLGVRRWSRVRAQLEQESAQRALAAVKTRRENALRLEKEKANAG